MKILFKFPSRGRPNRFKNIMINHLNHLSYKNEYKFIFTFDEDDEKMNNDDIRNFIKNLNIDYEIFYGNSKTKIEAINKNLENQDFDILILLQDDMIAELKNYDEVICDIFYKSENNLDCVIHFNTSTWSNLLDIWCVMGKKYYDRFNYIYNPNYKSIVADNEYTEVSRLLDKNIFSELCPFFHNHNPNDEIGEKNNEFNSDDYITYVKRKEKNFDL